MIVQVYYNLHKHCWSLRDKKTRRVIGHKDELVLKDCKFHVSEAGRQRVLKEKRKNVHAWIEGVVVGGVEPRKGFGTEVRYNPYETKSFVWVKDQLEIFPEPVYKAKTVHFFYNRTVRAAV